ncbi:hypothetical protein CY35_06G116700 [Sphagnum magellanicum]|nr:hypothetical protein CY35_06G116700 [Sphagnum magellanicum]KAH9560638.1 hypothetical protein CY35_06G116700 [Sphagnum magellanicum]
MMSTLRSMIGSDAEPPSVQWLAASVASGDVMEIAKLMVLLIMLTLTACGLYRIRCRPRAVQTQASSSPNTSTPPPTQAMGAVQSLNSIEASLEDVLTSVVSSDNNTVVPDSTNSNMVVIEMPSLALPA